MRILTTIVILLLSSYASAADLQCHANKAYDLATGEMRELSAGYLGIRAYSKLSVDAESGELSTSDMGTLPGTRLVSAIGDKDNPDLVIADSGTGAFFFRMRVDEPDQPFFLIDAYVVITGTCEKLK